MKSKIRVNSQSIHPKRIAERQFLVPNKRVCENKSESTFYCHQCGVSFSGTPFSFGGGLACESCVRAYYSRVGENEIREELRCRAYDASRQITKQNKRSRRPALWGKHLCDVCGGSHLTENCKVDY